MSTKTPQRNYKRWTTKVKPFLIFIATLMAANIVFADVSSETVQVQAVMFEWAFDKDGNIRHAQVIAGYATLDACQNAMRTVMGRAVVVEEGLTPQLLCQGIKQVTTPRSSDIQT